VNTVPASQIQRFEPRPEWFHSCLGGIHGLAHETRVLIWTQVISAMATDEGLIVDPDVLGWAAAIHDTQRWDEGVDSEHGTRAADWIEDRPDLLPSARTPDAGTQGWNGGWLDQHRRLVRSKNRPKTPIPSPNRKQTLASQLLGLRDSRS
jgi:hypothetical protein